MSNPGGKFKRIFSSLRVRFVVIFTIALILGVLCYFLGGLLSDVFIKDYYLSEENKAMREANYHEDLQEYIDDELITFETIDRVSEWAKKNQYVYLLVYKEQTDDEAYYVPDDEVEEVPDEQIKDPVSPPIEDDGATDENAKEPTEDGPMGGITIDWPTRSELEEEAKKKDMRVIELPDNQYVYVKFAEFTEYLYYDIINLISLGVGVAVVLAVLLFYISILTKRISSLGADVNIVATGNTDKVIEVKGEDELSALARNVETMRSSIVENYKRKMEVLDANTELITSMSHDIRTPLTVLLGYIDVMRSRTASDSEMQGYLTAAEKTALRLKKLSDDMFGYFLIFAKDEENMKLEKYDIITIFEQLLTEHILLIRESGYSIDFAVDEEALNGRAVLLDIASALRIVDNIFSNLYKYADEKESISISVSKYDQYVKISFKNEIKRDITMVESNGIGLKTCSKLAELMGARFEQITEENTFIVNVYLQIE